MPDWDHWEQLGLNRGAEGLNGEQLGLNWGAEGLNWEEWAEPGAAGLTGFDAVADDVPAALQ